MATAPRTGVVHPSFRLDDLAQDPAGVFSRRAALRQFGGGCGAMLLATAALRSTGVSAQDAATPAATESDPLPETARGPAIPADKGYFVEEIADRLYWVTEGTYQAMFLATGAGVIVVDAPPSIGENLLRAIAEMTDEPITHVVYSHRHTDHIGAATLYPADAMRIAHEATAARLVLNADPNRPIPTETFTDSYDLTVGDQMLRLEYQGQNHVPGNIFIHAPRQKVLMTVDIVEPGWVPFRRLGLAEDVFGFIQAHDQILGYDFETFVGGHLTRLGTRADVELQARYVQDLVTNAGNALGSVDIAAVGAEVGFENQSQLFDTFLNRVTDLCTEAMVATWRGQLGGVEAFTNDNSDAMVGYLLIN